MGFVLLNTKGFCEYVSEYELTFERSNDYEKVISSIWVNEDFKIQ